MKFERIEECDQNFYIFRYNLDQRLENVHKIRINSIELFS